MLVNQTINENLIEKFFEFHLNVLKRVLNGIAFADIAQEFKTEFALFNYKNLAKAFHLLSFNEKDKLIGAYPISPIDTGIKIYVEGISKASGYAMCAIDSLGVASLFNNSKTEIKALDAVTKKPIEITIDPKNIESLSTYSDIVITIPKTITGKNGKSLDGAVDVCPHIGFIKDKSTIEEKYREEISIIPFEQAYYHGKSFFEYSHYLESFKRMLYLITTILKNSNMKGDDIADIYLDKSKNSFLKSYPQDVARREVLKFLETRAIIQKETQNTLNVDYYSVTDKGFQFVQIFSE